MAVIRDVMPVFELFQPTSVDAALTLLETHYLRFISQWTK